MHFYLDLCDKNKVAKEMNFAGVNDLGYLVSLGRAPEGSAYRLHNSSAHLLPA